MSVSITFTAGSVHELHEKICDYCAVSMQRVEYKSCHDLATSAPQNDRGSVPVTNNGAAELAAATEKSVAEPAKEAPAKRGRKPKAKGEQAVNEIHDEEEPEEKSVISAAEIKAQSEEVEQDPFAEEIEADLEKELDFTAIRNLFQKLAETKGMDVARKVCGDLGAKTVSAIKEADYKKAAQMVKKALES